MMGMFPLCMKQILRILQVILITGGYTTTRDLETVEVPFVRIPTKKLGGEDKDHRCPGARRWRGLLFTTLLTNGVSLPQYLLYPGST